MYYHSPYLYCRIIIQVIGPPGARTSPPITGQTARFTDFVADQLIGLFAATLGAPRCSDIASYVGDSSELGFFLLED